MLVADQAYWESNALSNANGDWPVTVPSLAANADSVRNVVVFNGTFFGTAVDRRLGAPGVTAGSPLRSQGTLTVEVPLGAHVTRALLLRAPAGAAHGGARAAIVQGRAPLFEDALTFNVN